MKLILLYVVLLGFFLARETYSESDIKFENANMFYEFGSIVKGVELGTDTIDNMWVQRFGGFFGLEAGRGEHLKIYLGAGSIFWHAIPEIEGNSATQVFFSDAILSKAYASYVFGDPESPTLQAKVGYFPFKYSRSRNLGEYMFRTGTYPSYIITGSGLTVVNTSDSKVLGTQWTHKIGESFTHHLLFTSERASYPLHDFSLTYMGNFHFGLMRFGFGVQMARLIPVIPSKTTPTSKAAYFDHLGETYTTDTEYYRMRYVRYYTPAFFKSLEALQLYGLGTAQDSARANQLAAEAILDSVPGHVWWNQKQVVDSLTTLWDAGTEPRPEMNSYTFKGIKPVAHISLDFKSLVNSDMFKKEDLVLYGEAVLMGVKDYPIFYEDKMDRLALMAGFNIPTFGIFDVFNVEVERNTSKFANGYRNARETRIPLPDYHYNQTEGYAPGDWGSDDFKWSIYLARELTQGISLMGQVASDHLRGKRFTRVVTEPSYLVDSNHWYYMFKLQASL